MDSTTNQRELMVGAAKAAGVRIFFSDEVTAHRRTGKAGHSVLWNPFNRRSDADFIAARLRLTVNYLDYSVEAGRDGVFQMCAYKIWDDETNHSLAVCHAITLAAYEISKASK